MMVIGIDSHKDVLMGCLIDEKTRPVEYRSVQNTPRGHSEVVSWVRSCGGGRVAVEGSGNYGRPLAGAGFDGACIHVCVRWVLYCCGWCESWPERRLL